MAKDALTRALEKVKGGGKLTQVEERALRKAKKEEQERLRQQFYESVPLKFIVLWMGKTHAQLKKQQQSFNLPFGSNPVNLPDFFAALAKFLSQSGHRLSKADDRLADARYRLQAAQARKAELVVEREEGDWLPREFVEQGLDALLKHLHQAATVLNQKFGDDGYEILARAIKNVQTDIDSHFGPRRNDKKRS